MQMNRPNEFTFLLNKYATPNNTSREQKVSTNFFTLFI
jgi:hypothetical protein